MEPTSKPAVQAPLSPLASRLLEKARSALVGAQPDVARNELTKVLALVPGNAEAMHLMGIAAQLRRDHVEAIDWFRRALVAQPRDSDLHVALGVSLYEQGEADAAITQLRLARDLSPGSASAWLNLGEAFQQQAHTEDALGALDRALTIDPTHVPTHLAMARVQAAIGRIDMAVREFREALRHEPNNAMAWFGLSNLNTVHFSAGDAEHLRLAMAHGGIPAEARNRLGFALAKALEDQGDFAGAFDAFKVANASQRKQIRWNAAGERKRVDAIQRVFEGWSPHSPTDPNRGREAIMIASIPRSGSTLVEQILASHPEVAGANEINDMANVIDAESRRRHDAFPLWVPMATIGDWQRLGDEYIARTAHWRERKPRFTDKNLVSWYLVGVTLAMLPAARVVVVRRDPLETCLACFRQWLTGDAGFAYDLDEMADYCIDFMRLTRFWLNKFPDHVFDLEYETLVAEPEQTIRRLLDFCRLPFDQACLEFHRTERAVRSAPSAAQVRQPLRRDTARMARYGDKLDRLRARLRDAGVPFATQER